MAPNFLGFCVLNVTLIKELYDDDDDDEDRFESYGHRIMSAFFCPIRNKKSIASVGFVMCQ